MRVARGFATVEDVDPRRGDPRFVRFETFTCNHCNKLVDIPFRCSPAEAGGWCTKCDAAICGPCVDKPCAPFEKKLEQFERAIERNREVESWLR